jgi:hypothetical protein
MVEYTITIPDSYIPFLSRLGDEQTIKRMIKEFLKKKVLDNEARINKNETIQSLTED